MIKTNKIIKKIGSFNSGNFLIIGVVATLVLLNLFAYSRAISFGIQPYRIGDWLINYQGGFVRRGLIGQLIYLISTNKPNTIWIAYALQGIIYLVLSYFVLRLYFLQKRDRTWLLFLFSPAFIFLFPFYDSEGWFRKELLVYLAYVLLLYGLRDGLFRVRYLWISLSLYVCSVFSHEVASLTLIFFLYPLYQIVKQNPDQKRKIYLFMGVYGIVSVAGIVLAVAFPGGLIAVEKICQSLTFRGLQPEICDGAIRYLAYGMNHGLQEVMLMVQTKNYLLIYPALLLIAMVPIALTSWWHQRIIFLALGFISLLPLFFVATDWGRWIAIFTTLIFLSILFDSTLREIKTRSVSLLAVIAYASLWSIPHIQGWPTRLVESYIGSGPGLGVVDLAFSKIPHEMTLSPLRNPVWMDLGRGYKGLVFYPLTAKSSNQDVFYYYGLKNRVSSNIPGLGKSSVGLLEMENHKNIEAISSGRLADDHFYILDQQGALLVLQNIYSDKDFLAKVDSFFVYAPSLKVREDLKSANGILELAAFTPVAKIGEPIVFSSQKGERPIFLFGGWSIYSEDWGTWSDGPESLINLPLPKGRVSALKLNVAAFLPGTRTQQAVKIYMNDRLVKQVTLQRADDNEIELAISSELANQSIVTLRFQIEHPISPHELGMSMDRRKLGIGIKSAVFR